jgi:hypothetical protein
MNTTRFGRMILLASAVAAFVPVALPATSHAVLNMTG